MKTVYMKTVNMKTVNIKLLILIAVSFYTLTPDAVAKEKLSGKNYDGHSVFYKPEVIQSYGRIVMGETYYKKDGSESTTYVLLKEKHLFICQSKELTTIEYRSDRFQSNGNWIERINAKSSGEMVSVSYNLLIKSFGLSGLSRELESRCSNNNKKYPKVEIPLSFTVSEVFHADLSTFQRRGALKSIWIKERGLERTPYKDSKGEPLTFDGEVSYEYRILDPSPMKMSRWVFDCDRHLQAVIRVASYDIKGNVTDSFSIEEKKADFSEPIPGSVGESFQEFVCKL